MIAVIDQVMRRLRTAMFIEEVKRMKTSIAKKKDTQPMLKSNDTHKSHLPIHQCKLQPIRAPRRSISNSCLQSCHFLKSQCSEIEKEALILFLMDAPNVVFHIVHSTEAPFTPCVRAQDARLMR